MSMDHYERCKAQVARLNDPLTADNMEVRMALMNRVKAGEITLAEAQAKLARIKRNAHQASVRLAEKKIEIP